MNKNRMRIERTKITNGAKKKKKKKKKKTTYFV